MRSGIGVPAALLASAVFGLGAAAGEPWPHPSGQPDRTFYSPAPALSVDDVKILWTLDGVADFPSTVIDGSGNVFCFIEEGTGYSIVSLDPDDGSVSATYMAGITNPLGLCLGGGMLYAVADKSLLAWTVGNTTALWAVRPEDLYTVPVADSSGNVFVAGFGNLYCYAPDGTQSWSYALNASTLGQWPALLGGGVFISADSFLYGLNASSGSERFKTDASQQGYDGYNGWMVGAPDSVLWTGVLSGGQLYFWGGFNSLTGVLAYTFQSDMHLECITPSNVLVFQGGNQLFIWDQVSQSALADKSIGFNSSQVSCASDAIYLGDMQGNLYCYGLDGTLRWTSRIGDSTHFTSTFIAIDASGDLYVPLSGNRLAKVGPDVEPPAVSLQSVVVSGWTDDAVSTPVTALVGGVECPVDASGNFSGEVALSSNPQNIDVSVEDASGNPSSLTVTVTVP